MDCLIDHCGTVAAAVLLACLVEFSLSLMTTMLIVVTTGAKAVFKRVELSVVPVNLVARTKSRCELQQEALLVRNAYTLQGMLSSEMVERFR